VWDPGEGPKGALPPHATHAKGECVREGVGTREAFPPPARCTHLRDDVVLTHLLHPAVERTAKVAEQQHLHVSARVREGGGGRVSRGEPGTKRCLLSRSMAAHCMCVLGGKGEGVNEVCMWTWRGPGPCGCVGG
jgi:hypothetical protein